MLGDVAPTPQDIQFRILGIPCRIHVYFWIVAVLFALPQQRGLPGNLIIALTLSRMACLLVSILVHEMGHALLIRRAGFQPHIVLHGFGGYAMYQPHRPIRPALAIAISLAGPAAGFILYGIVKAFALAVPMENLRISVTTVVLADAIQQLEFINLYWGLVNLLPIYPLDGGQVARTGLTARWGYEGLRQSIVLSIIAAGGAAFWFYQRSGGEVLNFAVILFALLCYQSIQAYQSLTRS